MDTKYDNESSREAIVRATTIGAVVAGLLAFVVSIVRVIMTTPRNAVATWIGVILVASVFLALIAAIAGGVAGAFGAKCQSPLAGAIIGTFVVFFTVIFFYAGISMYGSRDAISLVVYAGCVGSVSGVVGTIAGRGRDGTYQNPAGFQFRLVELLMVVALFAVLCAWEAFEFREMRERLNEDVFPTKIEASQRVAFDVGGGNATKLLEDKVPPSARRDEGASRRQERHAVAMNSTAE